MNAYRVWVEKECFYFYSNESVWLKLDDEIATLVIGSLEITFETDRVDLYRAGDGKYELIDTLDPTSPFYGNRRR